MLITSVSALLLTGGSLLLYEYYSYKRMIATDLSTLAQTIAANSSEALAYNRQDIAQKTLSALLSEPYVTNACLFDKAGHFYAAYPSNAPAKAFPSAPRRDGPSSPSRLSLIIFEPVMQGGTRFGTLFIREDLHRMYRRFGVYAFVVLLVMAGFAGVAVLLSGPISTSDFPTDPGSRRRRPPDF
jgi:hypothetical protein